MAEEPRFGGRLHVLAAVPPDELLPWVASADVDVLPIQPSTLNHRLSTPNKLFESLAAGVPVVVSDFAEMHRIVLDDPAGPLGAVCDPSDVDAVAAAIAVASSSGRRRRRSELRARCLTAAHERWNWETEVSRLACRRPGDRGRRPPRERVRVGRGPAGRPARAPRPAVDRGVRFARLPDREPLAGRGHDVTILARAGDGLPDEERAPRATGSFAFRVRPATACPGPLRPRRGGRRVRPRQRASTAVDRRGTAAEPADRGRPARASAAVRRLAAIALTVRSQLAGRPSRPRPTSSTRWPTWGSRSGLASAARPRAGRLRRPRHLRRRREPRPVAAGPRGGCSAAERGWARRASRVVTVNEPYAHVMAARLARAAAARRAELLLAPTPAGRATPVPRAPRPRRRRTDRPVPRRPLPGSWDRAA